MTAIAVKEKKKTALSSNQNKNHRTVQWTERESPPQNGENSYFSPMHSVLSLIGLNSTFHVVWPHLPHVAILRIEIIK